MKKIFILSLFFVTSCVSHAQDVFSVSSTDGRDYLLATNEVIFIQKNSSGTPVIFYTERLNKIPVTESMTDLITATECRLFFSLTEGDTTLVNPEQFYFVEGVGGQTEFYYFKNRRTIKIKSSLSLSYYKTIVEDCRTSEGGGSVDTNMAEDNLTLDANRLHDLNGFDWRLKNGELGISVNNYNNQLLLHNYFNYIDFNTDYINLKRRQTVIPELRFYDYIGNNYIGFKAPETLSDTTVYVWPEGGNDGQVLSVEGDSLYWKNTVWLVDTHSDISGVNAGVGDIIKTKGYYQIGDEGGANYIVDSNLNTDNNLIVELDNGLFAQIQSENGVINVNQAGAKGDGVQDDYNSIQTLIDSSIYLGLNEVQFLPKFYKITSTISIDLNIDVTGAGMYKTGIEFVGSADNYVFILNNVSININNFTIANKNGHGMKFIESKHSNISKISAGRGLDRNAFVFQDAISTAIRDCVVGTNGGQFKGFLSYNQVPDTSYLFVSENTFSNNILDVKNCYTSGTKLGFMIDGTGHNDLVTSYMNVDNCTSEGGQSALRILSASFINISRFHCESLSDTAVIINNSNFINFESGIFEDMYFLGYSRGNIVSGSIIGDLFFGENTYLNEISRSTIASGSSSSSNVLDMSIKGNNVYTGVVKKNVYSNSNGLHYIGSKNLYGDILNINGNLKYWNGNIPVGYESFGTPNLTKDTDELLETYSLGIESNGTDYAGCSFDLSEMMDIVTPYSSVKRSMINVSMWVKRVSGDSPFNLSLYLGYYHRWLTESNPNNYPLNEWVLVTYSFDNQYSASSSKLVFGLDVNASAGDKYLVDAITISFGDVAPYFYHSSKYDIERNLITGGKYFSYSGNNEGIRVNSNDDCVITNTLYLNETETVGIFTGTGTPEGSIAASVGSTYHRTDGGAGTSYYIKESGTGNTGWVAK